MIPQLARFGAVGIAAMAVHWLIVAILVPLRSPPLLANVAGFAIAFNVSYAGHRRWTFAATTAKHSTFKRFVGVALLSFAVNEALYYVLLQAGMEYRVALLVVLVAVAALTFLLSRYWAFRNS
jgi:putative flippase GtrA